MQSTIYLLLISLGALSILGIFHFTIYLQQNDKAFRNYAIYLGVMSLFNVVRLLDARLTSIYPLSYYTVETLDPFLSNLGFLMYVNFLGVVLNITPKERVYYTCWKGVQIFVFTFLPVYIILRITGDPLKIANAVITIASFCCMTFGLFMVIRLLRFRKDIFYQLIIAGTLVAITGTITGLIMNVFVYKENLSFGGLFFLEPAMMIEAIFLSAALGYRLKLAYEEKDTFQQTLLEETQKRELLALQAADFLKKELDIKLVQSRISRDLHDDVGSSLSSLQIYSALATKLMDNNPEEAKKLLQHIADGTEEVMENMSHIVWAMQDQDKAAYSLEARIKNIGYNLLTIKDIRCHYTICKAAEVACKGQEIRKNIILITKEAINNIAKYSEATEATVSLSATTNHIILSIHDNGNGFDTNNPPMGNGLKNIQARCAGLGGIALIQSAIGKGVTITCSLPVTNIRDTITA